jgi:hypothetical protein
MSSKRLLIEAINLSSSRLSWFMGLADELGMPMSAWEANGSRAPDITLLGDPGLPTGQLLDLANSSHSDRVIMWSCGSPRLGLIGVNDPLNAASLAQALKQLGLKSQGPPPVWPPVPLTLPSQLG